MKKKQTIKNIFFASAVFLSITSCTKLDQDFYSEVTPEVFFKSEKDINAAVYRPFTHLNWYLGDDRWMLQEYTADNFAISTKGRHWYNGGENERFHYHKWTPDDGWIFATWRGTLMGVALALDAQSDLAKLDYSKFNLTEEKKQDDLNQLNALSAYFYMKGLDFFGGMPISKSLEQVSYTRNTDVETFNHIEKLLKEAIEKLPAKKAGDSDNSGRIKQGAAAAMLAQLYFNAKSYINKDMYAESQQICQDIIDQKYGLYSLDDKWFKAFTFNNNTTSNELIWAVPIEPNKLQNNWYFKYFYHYTTLNYFNINGEDAWNGTHLTPSRKPDNSLYDQKLGGPYEKFDNGDLRKKPYKYLGNGNYEGMFIVGPHLTPKGELILAGDGDEYAGKPLVFVDQVARFSDVGAGKKYSSISQLPSKMSEGEENTGVRLVKTPIPNLDNSELKWSADQPIIRLTEIYYMLAECKLRAGQVDAAAKLINDVRKKNFDGADPNPATVSNLNGDRMLIEWSIEFLGEGRRRTDLIRWDKFTKGEWWDHAPSNSDHLKRFPIPTKAISGNNKLEQNPGYN